MGTTGTVLMCVVLCSAIQPDFTNGESNFGRNSTSRSLSYELGRGIHRVQMLFPLLLGISGRLATLVPTALMGLFGIFLFVAFSKKAFIISLIALFLTYLDRFKKSEEKVIYVHRIVHPNHHHHHDHDEDFQQEEEHIHYHWPYKKHYNTEFNQRNTIPFRNWKRPQRRPYHPQYPQYQQYQQHPQYLQHPNYLQHPQYMQNQNHPYYYHRPEPVRRDTIDERLYEQMNRTEAIDFQEDETESTAKMENDIVENSQSLE